MNKRVLITGANGYIGKHVTKKCLEHGYDVLALDINNSNIQNLGIKYIKGSFLDNNIYKDIYEFNPETVIHLAWIDGFNHNSLRHLEDLNGHFNFLSNLIDHGIKKICALGTMHEIGYYEGKVDENTPCNPRSYYGIAKNTLRQALITKQSSSDFILYWLRGFYLTGDDENNHSIFSKMLKAEKEGKKDFPLNSGINQYDFIDIDLFAKMIVKTINQDKYTGIINICSGKPVSLKEKVEEFIKQNNLSITIMYGEFPDRSYDSSIIYGDNTIIEKIIAITHD